MTPDAQKLDSEFKRKMALDCSRRCLYSLRPQEEVEYEQAAMESQDENEPSKFINYAE